MNLVFILTDTQNKDMIGGYGGRVALSRREWKQDKRRTFTAAQGLRSLGERTRLVVAVAPFVS